MNDPPLLDDDLLAPSLALELDRVCDQFEAAWKTGEKPSIEEFLSSASSNDSSLLRELLLLEVSYRQLGGEASGMQDYLTRFPGQTKIVEDVFREIAARGGARSLVPSQAVTEPRAKFSTQTDTIPAPFIGKYRIVQRLGAGGQGEVFRAVHPNLPGRDVVIKWARRTLSAERREHLLSEGQVLAKLDAPGLVRVYDVDVHENRPYIVFEYVAGQPLSERLRKGPFPVRAAAQLVQKLARTLAQVHKQGVLHRDLKPHNVLIDRAGEPRLLDFGLAWMSTGDGTTTETPSEAICGTLQYMAPEQANGQGTKVGPHSDVFGLGAVLYELLTGRPPYQADDKDALWEMARLGRIVAPRQIRTGIPRALEAVCLKALALDPVQRYPTALHFERALGNWLHRPYWLAGSTTALLLLIACVSLTLGLFRHETQRNVNGSSAQQVPLQGELIVRVWSNEGGKVGTTIDQPGALPVRNGEMVQLEVKLNQPAYSHLIWVDSEGAVQPLFPWEPAKGFDKQPLLLPPQQLLFSPDDAEAKKQHGWPIAGPSGLETVLLLVRRTPLPAEYDLKARIGQLPKFPLRDRREFAVRGGDLGQMASSIDQGKHRGIVTQSQAIDEPLLEVLEKLRPDFELIRAVRFAHEND